MKYNREEIENYFKNEALKPSNDLQDYRQLALDVVTDKRRIEDDAKRLKTYREEAEKKVRDRGKEDKDRQEGREQYRTKRTQDREAEDQTRIAARKKFREDRTETYEKQDKDLKTAREKEDTERNTRRTTEYTERTNQIETFCSAVLWNAGLFARSIARVLTALGTWMGRRLQDNLF